MATTAQKLHAITHDLTTLNPADQDGQARELLAAMQMLRGFGVDLAGMLIPADPIEADSFVDRAIGFLLDLRGDDLPPFRHPGIDPRTHAPAPA